MNLQWWIPVAVGYGSQPSRLKSGRTLKSSIRQEEMITPILVPSDIIRGPSLQYKWLRLRWSLRKHGSRCDIDSGHPYRVLLQNVQISSHSSYIQTKGKKYTEKYTKHSRPLDLLLDNILQRLPILSKLLDALMQLIKRHRVL